MSGLWRPGAASRCGGATGLPERAVDRRGRLVFPGRDRRGDRAACPPREPHAGSAGTGSARPGPVRDRFPLLPFLGGGRQRPARTGRPAPRARDAGSLRLVRSGNGGAPAVGSPARGTGWLRSAGKRRAWSAAYEGGTTQHYGSLPSRRSRSPLRAHPGGTPHPPEGMALRGFRCWRDGVRPSPHPVVPHVMRDRARVPPPSPPRGPVPARGRDGEEGGSLALLRAYSAAWALSRVSSLRGRGSAPSAPGASRPL